MCARHSGVSCAARSGATPVCGNHGVIAPHTSIQGADRLLGSRVRARRAHGILNEIERAGYHVRELRVVGASGCSLRDHAWDSGSPGKIRPAPLRLGRDGEATVLAVGCDVLLLGSATEIGAIHFHHAGQLTLACSAPVASRSLWARTNAVLYWTSKSRPSWRAEMPFTAFTKIAMAAR
jgi:hypothetical protein